MFDNYYIDYNTFGVIATSIFWLIHIAESLHKLPLHLPLHSYN